MARMIFVNLPVTDLPRSRTFYEALGFTNNPQFSDDTAACMVWSETINVMLLTHPKWRSFTSRPIPPAGSSEVMLAISCDSRHAVDAMNDAAAKHGVTADINPKQVSYSCTTATSPIPMATCGKRCGWIRRRCPPASDGIVFRTA